MNKKNTVNLTLCAISAALATVITLAAYFPYITYAAPAVAGLVTVMLVIETNKKWALGSFVVSAVLVLLLSAESESKFLYVLFFGYYPIVKAAVESLNKPVLEWVMKLFTFNAAMLLIYGILSFVVDLSIEDFGVLGRYGAWIFLGLGNIVFVLYDFAILQIAAFYMQRIHPSVKRMFK